MRRTTPALVTLAALLIPGALAGCLSPEAGRAAAGGNAWEADGLRLELKSHLVLNWVGADPWNNRIRVTGVFADIVVSYDGRVGRAAVGSADVKTPRGDFTLKPPAGLVFAQPGESVESRYTATLTNGQFVPGELPVSYTHLTLPTNREV